MLGYDDCCASDVIMIMIMIIVAVVVVVVVVDVVVIVSLWLVSDPFDMCA